MRRPIDVWNLHRVEALVSPVSTRGHDPIGFPLTLSKSKIPTSGFSSISPFRLILSTGNLHRLKALLILVNLSTYMSGFHQLHFHFRFLGTACLPASNQHHLVGLFSPVSTRCYSAYFRSKMAELWPFEIWPNIYTIHETPTPVGHYPHLPTTYRPTTWLPALRL